MGLFVDRAAMSVSGTPGTGTITLGSAYYKHQTFAAAGVTNGQLVAYVIEDGASWEVGKGTYSSSGPTLARTTIYFSSNSNAAINASSSAVVSVTLTAEDIGPAGSSGYVQFNNAGAWGSSSNLFWDNANGRLGVGTASPQKQLHIVGSDGAVASFPTVGVRDALIIENNNNANINLINNGGTSVGSLKATISGGAAQYAEIGFAYNSGSPYTVFNIGGTERMRIDSAGNVGIGTSIPNGAAGYGWLTINGASAGGIISLSTANTEIFRIQSISGISVDINAIAAIPILFKTNNTERARISSDGTIAVNSAANPAVQFNIGGTLPSFSGNSYSVNVAQTIPSTSTNLGSGFSTGISTAAASFTCTSLTHFAANQGTFGAGSTVTNQYGFYASANIIGAASNNFGYWGGIPSGAGRYNFYAAGTADNQFNGNVLIFGAGGLGYTTGSGGTVTQATSRTTGVTLNKTNGAITLVSAAGSTTYQTFTVTNSAVAATDTIILNQKSGTDKYILLVTNVASGSFQITFATTGGTTTEQPVISFAVIKAVTA